MWRAFFLAVGISLLILGAECLIVDRVMLASTGQVSPGDDGVQGSTDLSAGGGSRVVVPPEWSPWSFFSAGAVVMIYSFTIPRRVKD